MLKIFFLILEFASLALIVGILGFFLSLKSSVSSSKLSPFECGFSPRLSSRMPFSLQFFLVALIFVIFDLELILLFPYLLYSKIYFSANCFFLMVFFIFLLTLGLLLEWNQQMLEWMA